MTTPSTFGRRTAIKLGLAGTAAALAPRRARAQSPREVKIALVVPLSGAWARQGILEQMGAELAIEDVNKQRWHQGARWRQAEAGRSTTPATPRRRPRTPLSAWWRRSPTLSAAWGAGCRASRSR